MRTMCRPLVSEVEQLRQQPSGQAADARLDRRHANRREMPEPDFDRRYRLEVQRAVLEACFAGGQDVSTSFNRREIHGAAGKPWAAQ
jgi:hypothetical protein